MRSILVRCALGALALSVAASVHAAPILNVSTYASAGVLGRPGDSDTSASSGTTSAGASATAVVAEPITSTSNFFVSGNGEGSASPGVLAASAMGLVQSTHSGGLTFLADNLAGGLGTAVVDFLIDDVVVSGSGGASTVPVSLWLDLSGGLGAGGSLNEPPVLEWPAGAGGTASVAVHVETNGATFDGTRVYSDNNRNEVSFGSTGLLASGDTFATPSFDVLVGTPFTLLVRMSLLAGASTNVTHGNANATASFGSTLRFPLDRPVFDVPEGYTVNSLSAGVVDNRVRAVGVPEPSTMLLLTLGVAAIGRAGRFRRRRP